MGTPSNFFNMDFNTLKMQALLAKPNSEKAISNVKQIFEKKNLAT